MKNSLNIIFRLPVLLAAAGLMATGFIQSASAAGTTTWSGGGGANQNWSDAANWTTVGGGTPPHAGDAVIFNATGAAAGPGIVNNIVDNGFLAAIGSLTISNDTAATFHTVQIPTGNTLTVNGPINIGGAANLITNATFTGGGTLVVSGGTNTVTVASTVGGAGMVCDMSGLTNFVCDSGGAGALAVSVGQVNQAAGSSSGTLNLAAVSNNITASTITVGDNNQASGNTCVLNLGGGTNIINAGTINIGFDKDVATVQFNTNLISGGLQLRNVAGTGRATVALCGNAHSGSSGQTTRGSVILQGHYVDMMIGTMTLATRGTRTGGSDNAFFGFDSGIVDVSTINMAIAGSAASGSYGYVTVGGGTLKVGNLSLVNDAGAATTSVGSLFITNGGVVNCTGNIFKTTPLGTGNITNYGGTISLASGATFGALTNTIDFLSLSNATLAVGGVTPTTTNVFVGNLDTENGGDTTVTNTISIGLLPGISSFPAYFHLILYTNGTAGITGAGTNFGAAGLSAAYTYYITNYTATIPGFANPVGFVDLAITAGPVAEAITWRGTPTASWNTADLDWLISGNPTNFNQGDFVTFNDAASGSTTVSLAGAVQPSTMTVSNTAKAYTFNGAGSIGGISTLVKQGTNTLFFDNSGSNTFSGAITLNAGTVLLGNADTSGNLGAGPLANNSAIIVNRTDTLTLANNMSGGGGLTNLGTGTLAVAGTSPSYTGSVMVAHGTLKLAASTALGTTNAGVLIASGAALDVGGFELTNVPVTVSGTGTGTAGAIINSGASIFPTITRLTLTGNTTLGGSGRWDVRSLNTGDSTGASLSTMGQSYNIIKTGTNTVGIAGVNVDPALGNIDIQQGLLTVESATTSLGNSASNLTVELGATLQLYQLTNLLNKVIVLNGNGTNTTLNNASGANTIIGPVTLNSSNIWSAGGTSLTVSGSISGSGSLTEIGGATLNLNGNNTYTNTTTVTNGILAINGINSGLPGVVIGLTNTTVTGTGTNTGVVTVNGGINPGSVGGAGTLTVSNLTLSSGATATFDLSPTTTVGSGVNDLLQVNGNLTLNNNTLTVNMLQGTLAAGVYRLINYTGTLSGSFNPTVVVSIGATRYTLTLNTSTLGQVNLVVGGSAANLVWDGTSDNTWDLGTTPNWLNTGTSLNDVFYQGDSVLLDDTVGVQTGLNLTNAVSPLVITNNSSSGGNNFSIAGPGKITGTTSIVKMGTSTLLLGTANDFSGTVNVLAGTLQVTNSAALGNTNGPTIITSGATLDVMGLPTANVLNLGLEQIIVSGSGVGGNGAIINSGTVPQEDATRLITLAGDTTFGGTGQFFISTGTSAGRWDMRGAGTTLSTGGHPYNLSKTGLNQVSLVGVIVDPALANIDIQQGMLGFEQSTTSMGNPADTITVEPGANLEFYQGSGTNYYTKNFVLNGDGISTNIDSANGVTIINGTMTLNNGCVIYVTSTALSNNCVIGGTGSLTKAGSGLLVLTATDTYSGNTTITGGPLQLSGTASISDSTNVNLAVAGAVLDVSARTDQTFTLASGQALTGIGTVKGSVTAGPNTIIMPGNNLNGNTLTITSNLVMNSCSNYFALAGSGPSADALIAVTNNLTLTGVSTLVISADGILSVGSSHTVIQYSGAFTGVLANLQAVGLGGFSFSVVDPATTPGSIQVMVTGVPANFVWRGGVPGSETNWDTVTTNWYDPNFGNMTNFMSGILAQWDDNYNPPYTNLNLVGSLDPLAMDFQDFETTYTFLGSGKVTGTGGLTMESSGGLIIANTGVNDFSGDINIWSSGYLQLGIGGTSGNVGSGNINCTNGWIVFDRSDNINIANAINGPVAGLTNAGTGVLTLSGNNTLQGPVTIAQGTLRVNNNNALGVPSGVMPTPSLLVTPGTTLDLGGPSFAAQAENLSNEVVTVSGMGIGGNGAIINSSTNSEYNSLRNVILTGDTWFGGPGNWQATNATSPGRWDIRGTITNCSLSTGFMPYNLYKIGSNHVGLVGVSIDNSPQQSLANIYVQQGKLQIESGTTSLGDVNSNLVVSVGATLGFYQSAFTNTFTKQFIFNGNGSTITVSNESGTTTLYGSNTLNGACNFGIGGTVLSNNCSVGGTGSLIMSGTARLVFSNSIIAYTGNTTVSNGTLQFITALPSSPLFDVVGSGAVLDVSGAGGVLALGSGQAVRGGGTIRGSLNAGGSAAVSVGEATSIGTLTVTNTVTLGGSSTTTMKINRTGAATNDLLKANSTMALGGTLNVTLLGGTLASGDTFTLFKAATGGLSGTFSATNLPALPMGLGWVATNLVNGIINVVSTVNTNPTNIVASVNGNVLTLTWPVDHTGWRLLAQTNSLNVGLNRNTNDWFMVPGSAAVYSEVITMDPTNGTVFYRLVYP